MSKIIVATAGEIGSGKGLASEYLKKKYGASVHRFSNMLRDVLDRLYLPHSRENIATTSLFVREKFGEDIMARVMKKDVENDDARIIVLDGVRRIEDIAHVKAMEGFMLVYVEASPDMRYLRVKNRSENTDENQKTYEQFLQDQQLESEVRIRELKKVADHTVVNEGSPEDFYAKLDALVGPHVGD